MIWRKIEHIMTDPKDGEMWEFIDEDGYKVLGEGPILGLYWKPTYDQFKAIAVVTDLEDWTPGSYRNRIK